MERRRSEEIGGADVILKLFLWEGRATGKLLWLGASTLCYGLRRTLYSPLQEHKVTKRHVVLHINHAHQKIQRGSINIVAASPQSPTIVFWYERTQRVAGFCLAKTTAQALGAGMLLLMV